MRVGIRCAYGPDFWGRVSPCVELGQIELAFYRVEDFLSLNPRRAIVPIKILGVKAPSIHLAQAEVSDIGKNDGKFLPVFFKSLDIAVQLGARLLVVHPTKGKVSKISPLIDDYLAAILEALEITLCWETFSGRRRFIGPVETIAKFVKDRPFQAICYDTAHVGESTARVLADAENYGELIKVWHLSNWNERQRHLPLSHPEGVLKFEPILAAIQQYTPDSVVTLEYLKPFHHLLLRDALRIIRMMSP